MKVYVIDNGGQWTHREWRVIRDLGAESAIIPNTTSSQKLKDADGVVLSGGAPSIVNELGKLGVISEYVRDLTIPILGICVGAQFIALSLGGRVGPGKVPEYGKTEVHVTLKDGILSGIPDSITVWESHNDEIKDLPPELILQASSANCRIQAFRHSKRPVFGVQFHPEVNDTEKGTEIFANFLSVCRGGP